jgi:prepilin-type N-terminal cleavage/methylation domain-containing protein
MENKTQKKRKYFSKGRQGFSMMEIMVAVFIFSVVMVAVLAVLVNMMQVQKRAKASQRNLEDARFTMETLAKNLRGSKLVNGYASIVSPIEVTALETYDYSQGKCIKYVFFSGDGTLKSTPGTYNTTNGTCTFNAANSTKMISNKNTVQNMHFYVTKANADSVPRVTISMTVCSLQGGGTCSDQVSIQTTVSLRN